MSISLNELNFSDLLLVVIESKIIDAFIHTTKIFLSIRFSRGNEEIFQQL